MLRRSHGAAAMTPVVAAALLVALLAPVAGAQIQAAPSYEEALAQAKTSGSLVVIDFFTDW